MNVALTFDAEHPDQMVADPVGNAVAILDQLRSSDVQATFFVTGVWAKSYPGLVARIVEEGHLLGSHGFWHCPFGNLTHEAMRLDLERSRETLVDVSGVDPQHWFRLPQGQGLHDATIRHAVEAEGFHHIHWDSGAEDWRPGIRPVDLARQILSAVETSQITSQVMLLHSWPEPTPTIVSSLIASLQSAHTFVRLDELRPEEVPYWATRSGHDGSDHREMAIKNES